MPEEPNVTDTGAASGDGDNQSEAKFTQDDVNRMVGAARKEARTAFLNKFGLSSEDEVKNALEEAERLRQAQMSDTQKLEEENARLRAAMEAAQQAAQQAAVANLRASIARTKGLPEGLVARVTGEDEESITADVEELLQFAKVEQQQQDIGSGTNPPGAAGNLSPDEQMAGILVNTLTSQKMR